MENSEARLPPPALVPGRLRKSKAPEDFSAGDFRYDTNGDGTVNGGNTIIVRARSSDTN